MSNSAEPSPSKGSESEPATKNDSTSYEAGDARSTWVATTLRANPDVLALRERTAPLHGQPSLALLSHPAHTEVPDVLGRAHVVGLLVQWMREKGYTSAAAQLVAEAQVPDGPGNGLGPDQLVPMLQACAPDNAVVFTATSDAELSRAIDDDPEVQVNVELPGGLWADLALSAAEDDSSGGPEGSSSEAASVMTLPQVAHALVFGDESFRLLVATTHTAWSSAAHMLRQLIRLYHAQPASPEGEARQARVMDAIAWFSVACNGPQELLVGLLNRFASVLSGAGRSKHAHQMRVVVSQLAGPRAPPSRPKMWEEPQVPKNIFSPALSLGDVPVLEIARQMTLLDHALFVLVKPSELLSLGWLSGEERERGAAAHVCALMRRFHVVERWISSTVVRESSTALQHAALSHALALGTALLGLGSLHSAAAVLGGITAHAVWRLRAAFALLSPEDTERMAQLEAVTSHMHGWRAYRERLALASRAGPVVPFLYPHLQTVALLMHAQPSLVHGHAVDMAKFRVVFDELSGIQRAQTRQYPLLRVDQIRAFLTEERLSKAAEEHALVLDSSQ